jgi:ankyrin repeat protein
MGHAECVKLLLDAGASALAAVDVAGSSALAEACRAGSLESVRLLLLNPAARVLVNRADMMGRTPLMTACAAGVAEIGELLIRAGADLTAEDRNARTAMHWAASQGPSGVLGAAFGPRLSAQPRWLAPSHCAARGRAV